MNDLKKVDRHPPQWVRNLAKLNGVDVEVCVVRLKYGACYYYQFRKCVGSETYLVRPNPLIPGYDRTRKRKKWRRTSLRITLARADIVRQLTEWLKPLP